MKHAIALALLVVACGRTHVDPGGGSETGLPPVFVVPGYASDEGSVADLVAALKADGRDVHVVVGGTAPMTESARALDDAVTASGADIVDVVGFSAGGLVVRTWVVLGGGAARARHVVTLAAPHHGSTAIDRGDCRDGCVDLLPGSALLRRLGTALPAGPDFVAFWTADDDAVTPPDSAKLEGAKNVKVQDVCPAVAVRHSGLLTDVRVLRLVVGAAGGGTAASISC